MPVIRIMSTDGDLIWAGPGRLEMGPEGLTGLRQEDRWVNLADLLLTGLYQWHAYYDDSVYSLDENSLVDWPMMPQPVRWELEVDLPRAAVRVLWHRLSGVPENWPGPVRTDASMPHTQIPPEAREDLAAEIQQVQVAIQRVRETVAQAAEGFRQLSEAFRPDPGYDELIEQTRAEFPHDPYRYGRVHPEGPHRWTPPDDPEEKVSRCPA